MHRRAGGRGRSLDASGGQWTAFSTDATESTDDREAPPRPRSRAALLHFTISRADRLRGRGRSTLTLHP